ncbi:MAG: branched chain amino acid aminotransferase, partial [Sediminibacterium sp.]
MSTPVIPVIKNTAPKLPTYNMKEIAFGKNFTDHMLVADYENGEWKNVVIKPYEPLQLDPSCAT